MGYTAESSDIDVGRYADESRKKKTKKRIQCESSDNDDQDEYEVLPIKINII